MRVEYTRVELVLEHRFIVEIAGATVVALAVAAPTR
jgi:hypothetical protein